MIIAQGAEAVIKKEKDVAVKERLKKSYRIDPIDDNLRKFRTRREAKVIEKISSLGFGPKLVEVDDKKMVIKMDFIDGPKLRDVLEKHALKYSKELGEKIAILHNEGIIHGDLTTSNMIVFNEKIYLIDFGLSFFSDKIEDKAVDLHLLRQALESKHSDIFVKCFEKALEGYKKCDCYDDVLKRLEDVEKRGRHKHKQ